MGMSRARSEHSVSPYRSRTDLRAPVPAGPLAVHTLLAGRQRIRSCSIFDLISYRPLTATITIKIVGTVTAIRLVETGSTRPRKRQTLGDQGTQSPRNSRSWPGRRKDAKRELRHQ